VIKDKFSALLLQYSVSRDPSEIISIHFFIISINQETILIIIYAENSCLIFFSGFLEIEIFCNIINVFTVTSFNSIHHLNSTSCLCTLPLWYHCVYKYTKEEHFYITLNRPLIS